MALVKSRVNGLIINIPADARGVISNHFMTAGDNELVFDPKTPTNPAVVKGRRRKAAPKKEEEAKAEDPVTITTDGSDEDAFEDLR